MSRPKTVVLTILDGWGCNDSIQNQEFNAIYQARKPVWDRLWNECPHTFLRCSGAEVGLPAKQMGNSEVGHLNLGAGRVVYQEITRISRSIRTGSFFTNQTLTNAVDQAITANSAIHILGLLSAGGVHSHEDHIHAALRLAVDRGVSQVYLHAFLDGRDTAPRYAEGSLRKTQELLQELGKGQIASMIGRYYAMDRDHRWPRIQKAYDLITSGEALFSSSDPLEALQQAYDRGETDEFVQATAFLDANGNKITMNDGDVVVFMNFRSDRARQITRPFIEAEFGGFIRKVQPKLTAFVSLTEYHKDFDIPVAFPPEHIENGFGEYISKLGLHQLRLAETEKYAHVTFFFNGGIEKPFEGEDRILIPSPKVQTYDRQPEMSAHEVTDHLVNAIQSGQYDVIVCNFANPDMVGHTGNLDATVKAIETIDYCLSRIITALHSVKGEMLITADHGNAELMQNKQTGQAHTAHTTNEVPLLYLGRPAHLLEDGVLSDVAPTLLKIMDLDQPVEMTGHALIEFIEQVD